jgi:hypothetical protein
VVRWLVVGITCNNPLDKEIDKTVAHYRDDQFTAYIDQAE